MSNVKVWRDGNIWRYAYGEDKGIADTLLEAVSQANRLAEECGVYLVTVLPEGCKPD